MRFTARRCATSSKPTSWPPGTRSLSWAAQSVGYCTGLTRDQPLIQVARRGVLDVGVEAVVVDLADVAQSVVHLRGCAAVAALLHPGDDERALGPAEAEVSRVEVLCFVYLFGAAGDLSDSWLVGLGGP